MVGKSQEPHAELSSFRGSWIWLYGEKLLTSLQLKEEATCLAPTDKRAAERISDILLGHRKPTTLSFKGYAVGAEQILPWDISTPFGAGSECLTVKTKYREHPPLAVQELRTITILPSPPGSTSLVELIRWSNPQVWRIGLSTENDRKPKIITSQGSHWDCIPHKLVGCWGYTEPEDESQSSPRTSPNTLVNIERYWYGPATEDDLRSVKTWFPTSSHPVKYYFRSDFLHRDLEIDEENKSLALIQTINTWLTQTPAYEYGRMRTLREIEKRTRTETDEMLVMLSKRSAVDVRNELEGFLKQGTKLPISVHVPTTKQKRRLAWAGMEAKDYERDMVPTDAIPTTYQQEREKSSTSDDCPNPKSLF